MVNFIEQDLLGCTSSNDESELERRVQELERQLMRSQHTEKELHLTIKTQKVEYEAKLKTLTEEKALEFNEKVKKFQQSIKELQESMDAQLVEIKGCYEALLAAAGEKHDAAIQLLKFEHALQINSFTSKLTEGEHKVTDLQHQIAAMQN